MRQGGQCTLTITPLSMDTPSCFREQGLSSVRREEESVCVVDPFSYYGADYIRTRTWCDCILSPSNITP